SGATTSRSRPLSSWIGMSEIHPAASGLGGCQCPGNEYQAVESIGDAWSAGCQPPGLASGVARLKLFGKVAVELGEGLQVPFRVPWRDACRPQGGHPQARAIARQQ